MLCAKASTNGHGAHGALDDGNFTVGPGQIDSRREANGAGNPTTIKRFVASRRVRPAAE